MNVAWNISFENRPNQNDFGSVTGSQIRQTKRAFKERFEVEHTFDETAAALGSHRRGLCSIISTAATPPISLGTRGGLQRGSSSIYFDSGTLPILVGSMQHADMTGAIVSDHPQYFDRTETSIAFNLHVKNVKGLPINHPTISGPTALSVESHMPLDAGIARHDPPLNIDDLATTHVDAQSLLTAIAGGPYVFRMQSVTVPMNSTYELSLPPRSSFPSLVGADYVKVGSHSEEPTLSVRMVAVTTDHADFRGRIILYNPSLWYDYILSLAWWEPV